MSPSNPTHTHLLSILQTLPLSSPTLKDLLTTHKPFQHPSHLPQTATTKLIQRINAAILSKDPSATSERRAACEIMAGVLEMDEEGWVFGGWGRGLVGCSIGVMSVSSCSSPLFSFFIIFLDLVFGFILVILLILLRSPYSRSPSHRSLIPPFQSLISLHRPLS